MNTFKVYILNIYTNIYQEVSLATMPFAFGNLLDERLDEANIVVYSSVEKYEPSTRVQIVINKDGTDETTLFFDIANDRSHKLYPASTTYEHELYLIEITKELEGFMCQSITFTSASTNLDDIASASPLAIQFSLDGHSFTSNYAGYTSPVMYNSQNDYYMSLGDFEDYIDSIIAGYDGWAVADGSGLEYVSKSQNGIQIFKTDSADATVSMETDPFTLTYHIYVATSEGGGGYGQGAWLTFQWYIDVVQTTEKQKPYTITDCIKRVLALAEPLRKNANTSTSEQPRFSLSVDDEAKYSKILAPDFTMTKCTLREQLKVIGGFIHCEPRLLDDNTIKFDPLGLGNEATISNAPYVDETISWSINEYNTAIETNASNIVNTLNKDEATLYDNNAYNTRTIRTDVYTLVADDDSSFIKTALPIQEIYKVTCTPYNADGTVWNDDADIDITDYVCEKHDYDRKSSFRGNYPYVKAYALYYTKGSNNIRGLFYKATSITSTLFPWINKMAIVNILERVTSNSYNSGITTKYMYLSFRVEYLPIYSAMFSHSKQYISPTDIGKKKPFYKPYAQSENMIESSYYGENIKGVAQRMGNPEKTCTFVMKDLTNIPSVGQMFKGYAISGVNVEVLPNVITCSLALTKDFNRISQYIGITSNKRVYEVSELEAYARNILLREYIIVYPTYRGNGVYNQINNDSNTLLTSQYPIEYTFKRTDDTTITQGLVKPVSACASSRYDKTDFTNKHDKTLLPVISSAFGNVASFSWEYKDNYSAGEYIENNSGDAFYSTDVSYADYFGRLYWYNFDLYSKVSDGGLQQAMTDGLGVNTLTHTVAQVSTGTKPYLCMKDNREILGFNYQLEFISADENIFIGSALAKEFTLVSGYKKHTNENPTKLICYVMDTPISKFAHKIDPTGLSTIELDENHYNDDNDNEYGFWLTVSSANDGKYFCIATQPKPVTKTYDDNGTTESITTEQGNDIVLWGKLRRNPNSYRMKFKFAIKRTIYK